MRVGMQSTSALGMWIGNAILSKRILPMPAHDIRERQLYTTGPVTAAPLVAESGSSHKLGPKPAGRRAARIGAIRRALEVNSALEARSHTHIRRHRGHGSTTIDKIRHVDVGVDDRRLGRGRWTGGGGNRHSTGHYRSRD